jgi:arylsulfatase A-like enzyme
MFTRRNFLTSGFLPLLGAQPSRPNVLMIAIDDLNDWIGPLGGNPQAQTPNFDRLAKRSVVFTRAYCNAPLCNPSRASLLTGIRPSTSGVYENNQPWRQSPALKEAVTLPQHFRENGYAVLGTGKTFHDSYPDPASWDDYFPSKTRQKPADPLPAELPANGIPRTAHFDWGPLVEPDEAMGDFQVVEWASRQLRTRRSQPLFLACGLFRPHLPWYVPKKYFDRFPLDSIVLPKVNDKDLDDVPPIGVQMAKPNGDHAKVLEHGQWRKAVQAYLAAISFADAQLGRLLTALESSPYASDTQILLWSDHGWHLGEKLHWRKFSLWEEATRNVLMMSGPGIQPARCERTVSMIDLYPTLIDTCRLTARPGLEGTSLRPLLENPKATWNRPALCTYRRGNHAVRDERWRYIRYHDGTEELYDHSKDPLEWTNLAAREELTGVKSALRRWLPASDAPDSPTGPGGADN